MRFVTCFSLSKVINGVSHASVTDEKGVETRQVSQYKEWPCSLELTKNNWLDVFQSETWFCAVCVYEHHHKRAFLCVKSLWITVPHLWPAIITILLTMSSITPWCTEKQRNYIWYKCSLLWGVAYYSCICYFTPILSVTTFFLFL